MNLFISARAGSGKTYTLVEKARALPPGRHLFLAFNKTNALELPRQLPPSMEAMTFNSCGNKVATSYRGYCRANEDKVANLLHFKLCNAVHSVSKKFRPAVSLVAICKCRGLRPDELTDTTLAELEELYFLDTYQIPESCSPADEAVMQAAYYKLVRDLYSLSLTPGNGMDFNDQLLMPVLDPVSFPYYDTIFVDEAQDLNLCQIKFLMRFAETNPNIHYVFVGDPFQAIYAFRGADVTACQTIIDTFKCEVTTLPVCRRCSQRVIEEARKVVPDIEAMPDAPTGTVTYAVPYHELASAQFITSTTFVLCRVRAPLVKLAINYLRLGMAFELRAVSSWEPVLVLHRKVADASTKSDYILRLTAHVEKQIAVLKKKGKRSNAASLADSFDILRAITDSLAGRPLSSIPQLLEDLSRAGDSRASGLVLSTIHRAKGLEATTVYLLRPDLLPHPLAETPVERAQERNLRYVAVTRARTSFHEVELTDDEKEEAGIFVERRPRMVATMLEERDAAPIDLQK